MAPSPHSSPSPPPTSASHSDRTPDGDNVNTSAKPTVSPGSRHEDLPGHGTADVAFPGKGVAGVGPPVREYRRGVVSSSGDVDGALVNETRPGVGTNADVDVGAGADRDSNVAVEEAPARLSDGEAVVAVRISAPTAHGGGGNCSGDVNSDLSATAGKQEGNAHSNGVGEADVRKENVPQECTASLMYEYEQFTKSINNSTVAANNDSSNNNDDDVTSIATATDMASTTTTGAKPPMYEDEQAAEHDDTIIEQAHAQATTAGRNRQPHVRTAEARERKRQSRKRARHAAARRNRPNTSVYVTGVPSDASCAELGAHFAKCGLLLPDVQTGLPRIKLYAGVNGSPKGDALVTYAFRPSVENALAVLDGAPLRGTRFPLAVSEASFHHKEEKEQETGRENEEGGMESSAKLAKTDGGMHGDTGRKLPVRPLDLVMDALAWDDEPVTRPAGARIVILQNVFSAHGADGSGVDYDMVREDMEEGCGACGTVEKITVFERSVEGAVAVQFATAEACLKCIDVMNGRWYDGRKLVAQFFDGKTDYRYKESESDLQQRDQEWQRWLEGSGAPATVDVKSAE